VFVVSIKRSQPLQDLLVQLVLGAHPVAPFLDKIAAGPFSPG